MTLHHTPGAGAVLAILLMLGAAGVAADPPRMDGARNDPARAGGYRPDDASRGGFLPDTARRQDTGRYTPRWTGPAPRLDPNVRLDSRHRHDRYYPPPGRVYDRLPRHPIEVHHQDSHYYFYGGVWYRPQGPGFIVVRPPIGLGISILPPYYTTVWFGGLPYYYADEVYYTWQPDRREYVVVNPPENAEAYLPPAVPVTLFVYPKQGQDEAQIATDRYECHRWAVDQTGFDPVQPPADLPASQLEAKRADYQRATTACLEARGYSVR